MGIPLTGGGGRMQVVHFARIETMIISGYWIDECWSAINNSDVDHAVVYSS